MKAYSIKDLTKILQDTVGCTVPVISAPAGTGKTTLVRPFGETNGYERIIIKRMSGITDEIFVGIPNRVGNHFEFLKMSFIKDIQEHKEEKILLVLDEINRTPERLRPVLFSLFEKLIEDEYYPNLDIICCINDGDDYALNWDIREDAALYSRMMVIEYLPNHVDAIDFMIKNNYNKVYVDALSRVAKIISFKRTEEKEQTTNYRSHAKMNHILQKNNSTEIKDVSRIVHEYGLSVMNKEIYSTVTNTLQQMIRTLTTYNIKEIIIKGEMPKTDNFEIQLAIKDFVTDIQNTKFTNEHIANIVSLLKTNKEILVSAIKGMLKIVSLNTILKQLSTTEKATIIKILE